MLPVLQRILDAALSAVEPRAATARALRRYEEVIALPAQPGRTWLAAAGKAAAGMAEGAAGQLGRGLAGGTVVVPAHTRLPELPETFTAWEAGHPVPSAHSLAAASDALRVARAAAEGDVLLCLVSGGASALWAAPPPGITLSELRATTAALLRSAVPIDEINAVRKHLSRIGGGGLARAAAPARVVTLAISDVVGCTIDAIGSGPAVPDSTTFSRALAVARGVPGVPAAVLAYLQRGAAGDAPETARPGERAFEGSSAYVVADPRDALAGAAAAAEAWGFPAEVVAEPLSGEARAAAAWIAGMIRSRLGSRRGALLLAGETTVQVRGDGRGGRNQELALALALELRGVGGWCALAVGTDGVDGPTPAAGAWVDGETARRGARAGTEPAEALERNDSHGFFARAGGLIVTGPTGTNVADLLVVLLGGEDLGDAHRQGLRPGS